MATQHPTPYPCNGVSVSILGLSITTEQRLHALNIHTIEQLALLALVERMSQRHKIIDLIEQELRARLPDFIVHCYVLPDIKTGHTQFIIESDLFHFTATVIDHFPQRCTCAYSWLDLRYIDNVPFHLFHVSPEQVKQYINLQPMHNTSHAATSNEEVPPQKQHVDDIVDDDISISLLN